MKEITSDCIMPKERLGELLPDLESVKGERRSWDTFQEDWVWKLYKEGFTLSQIGFCVYRTATSIQNKIRRLKKNKGVYNEKHIEEKYKTNREFLDIVKPKSVLDAYSGNGSFYNSTKVKTVVSNDKNKRFKADYNMKSERLLKILESEGKKFDLVDLDPFGSAAECYKPAIRMAKKALIVTLGNIRSKHFKRIDYAKKHEGINNLKEFNSENMMRHIINLGLSENKVLTPIFIKKWRGVSRVYFKIEQNKC